MIYSNSASALAVGPGDEAARQGAQRALLALGERRLLLAPAGGTIGRSRDCDVVLDDSGASRRHAELRPGPEGWTVADLGSTNGVLLNGRQLGVPTRLSDGDVIGLGSVELIFEVR